MPAPSVSQPDHSVRRIALFIALSLALSVWAALGQTNPPPLKFTFGLPSAGYALVLPETTYAKDPGYGFEPGASEGLKPYALVRGGLWALVKRALFYDLVGLGETRAHEGEDWFGVVSSGIFFPMIRAAEIEGL